MTLGIRLLVTGSRDWPLTSRGRTRIRAELDAAVRRYRVQNSLPPTTPVTLVSGGAAGADQAAEAEAISLGWRVERHPADWSRGSAAGFHRNQEMVDSGATLVLAFWRGTSPGTHDCINRALAAGLAVSIIRPPDDLPSVASATRR